jgi:hypothetical protein
MTALNAVTAQTMHISVVAPSNILPNDSKLASQYYSALYTQMIVDGFDTSMKRMAGMVTLSQVMNQPLNLQYLLDHMKITHPAMTYADVQAIYTRSLPTTQGGWALALDNLKSSGLAPAISNMSHYYAGTATKPVSGGYTIPSSFCNGGWDTAVGFLAIAGVVIGVMASGGLLAAAFWVPMATGIGWGTFGYGTARMLCA